MKQQSPHTRGEAHMDRQRTRSAMLLLPPNIICNLTPEEEKTLARQIAEQDDEEATIRLYCCCLEIMFRYFYRKTWGDRPETENLTQETLTRAWQGLRNGSWMGQAFRPWLFGIARNVFFEWLRDKPKASTTPDSHQSQRTNETEQVEQFDELLDEVLMRELGTTLWGLVGEMSELDRIVLFLRFHRDLPYSEIATLTNRSEQACKTRAWRALRQLREKIVQAGLGEELRFGKGRQQHI